MVSNFTRSHAAASLLCFAETQPHADTRTSTRVWILWLGAQAAGAEAAHAREVIELLQSQVDSLSAAEEHSKFLQSIYRLIVRIDAD